MKRGQDLYVQNTHLSNRFQTATATAANIHGTNNKFISSQTVRNCLQEGGLSACRPYVGCVLVPRHCVNRVNWARTHQCWLQQQWNRVLFSDNSRLTIHQSDGMVRVYYYHRRNERYANCCIHERDRFGGGGSVLAWAGIAHGFCTNRVVIEGNLNAQSTRIKFLQGTLSHCFKIMPISLFFSMIMPQAIQLGTM